MVAEFESTAPPTDRVLVLTRLLNAPRELVFQVWSQPEHLAKWWGPKDFCLPSCEQDFRPGGAYKFCMRAPDGTDHWVWGVYQEIVRPERIVFTWERDAATGHPVSGSVVTVTLVEENGQTKLTLSHALFETTADRNAHQGGWTECLTRLAEFVEQF